MHKYSKMDNTRTHHYLQSIHIPVEYQGLARAQVRGRLSGQLGRLLCLKQSERYVQ